MKAFVTIYSPLELFPPSINAIESLSKACENVEVITTYNILDSWVFPSNVKVRYIAQIHHSPSKNNAFRNIFKYLKYCLAVSSALWKKKFDFALLFDPHATFAYWMAGFFLIKKTKLVWYHNHDVLEIAYQRILSPGWLGIKSQNFFFRRLDIFSLPSDERKQYFPLAKFRGKYFFLPNYPSSEFYKKFKKENKLKEELRIIYQGRIAEGHGLEEIISILNRPLNGFKLKLVLKGFIGDKYKNKLLALAAKNGTVNSIEFYGISDYSKVPEITSQCHIGIAIHTKVDIMNSTLGTSSNKIYEYAALGLPVLLYDNEHFRKHLQSYKWAFFTDCSTSSLEKQISEIVANYNYYSSEASNDFLGKLNFDVHFSKVVQYITEILNNYKKPV